MTSERSRSEFPEGTPCTPSLNLLPTGSPRLIRLHSGFITEAEILRITSFLKKMAEPLYNRKRGRPGFSGYSPPYLSRRAV